MPFHSTQATTPTLALSSHQLDDIALIRAGVNVLSEAQSPIRIHNEGNHREVDALDPEGAPLARLQLSEADGEAKSAVVGVSSWLAPRPPRPFEELHRAVDPQASPSCVVVLDHLTDSAEIVERLSARSTHRVLLLFPIAVERDGVAAAGVAKRVRRVLDLRLQLSEVYHPQGEVETVLVPVDTDHPHRQERLAICAAAYSHGCPVEWLLTDQPANATGAGAVLLFTGLSGSGKSTLARAVRNRILEETDRDVTLLDGDVLRRHLSVGLGFSVADRNTNVARIGWVASQIVEHQGLAICSPIAPFTETREAVRRMVTRAGGQFILIHVATPLTECERRDRKGLYARARAGQIPDFTGISSPYEEPVNPDLRIDTTGSAIEPLVDQIMAMGEIKGLWTTHPSAHHDSIDPTLPEDPALHSLRLHSPS